MPCQKCLTAVTIPASVSTKLLSVTTDWERRAGHALAAAFRGAYTQRHSAVLIVAVRSQPGVPRFASGSASQLRFSRVRKNRHLPSQVYHIQWIKTGTRIEPDAW